MNAPAICVGLSLALLSAPAMAFEPGACVRLQGATLSGESLPSTSSWTVVEFWATWCAPCETSVESVRRLVADHDEVRLVGINSEKDVARVRRFAQARGWRFPTLLDARQTLLSLANPRALPFTALLDPSGCVVWQASGGDEATLESLRKALEHHSP